MYVGIPTHVKYIAIFLLVLMLLNWVCAPEMTDLYKMLDFLMTFVQYKYKYRNNHPVFGNTHTYVDFYTHVWFLPNTSTGPR